jgi:hypothetical protein
MGISNVTETALLALIFNATAWANVADNAASSPITQIAVGLHTADPADGGNMSTSEVGYTSYARVNVNRNSGGWTVSGDTCNPVANIDFPVGTGGSGSVTYFSAGKTGGGAAQVFMSGAVSPAIATGNGVTPRLGTATSFVLD